MTRRSLFALLLAPLVALAALALQPPAGADTIGAEDLSLVARREVSPRLHELTFRTRALSYETSVRVLVPEDFDPAGPTRYPVLYLLHGGGGSFRDWTDSGDAAAATAGLPLIVVMPDNNKHGNYVDWYNAGQGGPPMWETFIIGQLLPWIDAHYPTVGQRNARAVAGLSMGGGGAMGYGSRHPDLFVAAAAFSGAVDTNTVPVQLLATTSGMGSPEARLGGVFGLRIFHEVRWRGHNPWDLAANLRDLYVHLATGNGAPGGPGGDLGDPVELAVWQMMTNLHNRLVSLSIPHLWDDYGAGGHSWFYWSRELKELLPPLMDVFEERRSAPATFSFTAIEPSYRVWGWDVTIDRPALEFSHLVEAGRDGFRIRGTGQAAVTTAGYFEPGQEVRVAIRDRQGRRADTIAADPSGRITVAVDLGPGNPHQQFTIPARIWMLTTGRAHWPVYEARVTIDGGGTLEQRP